MKKKKQCNVVLLQKLLVFVRNISMSQDTSMHAEDVAAMVVDL